jgi:DNA-binding protein WhiA
VLSDDLRDELAAIVPRRDCDRLAELSGLFHSAGAAHFRGRGKLSVHLDLASSAVARRAFSLLRKVGVASELRTYRRRRLAGRTRFQLHVPGTAAARRVLYDAGVLDRRGRPLERPPKRVVGRGCCRSAYLRGALLGSGSLSGPPHPHLEIRSATVDGAEFIASVAEQEKAPLRVSDRSRHAIAYAKGIEKISNVLGVAGANDVLLALEEHTMLAATRSAANRLANADHANLVRSSRAAHAQVQAVRRLERAHELERLPDVLREVADLRLRYPTLSLRELARKCDPPASKAAAHRRLRRVLELADRTPAFPD